MKTATKSCPPLLHMVGCHSRTLVQTRKIPLIHEIIDVSVADSRLFLWSRGWESTGLAGLGVATQQGLMQIRYSSSLSTVHCHLKDTHWDFPGDPVVKTSPSNAGGVGSFPGWGAKIPHASQPKTQNIKQKQYCNKFNKDFKKTVHIKKHFFNIFIGV